MLVELTCIKNSIVLQSDAHQPWRLVSRIRLQMWTIFCLYAGSLHFDQEAWLQYAEMKLIIAAFRTYKIGLRDYLL